MNIALIVAAGNGNRMHQSLPKQFIHVYDKPLILYTLEEFQGNPNIDLVAVVMKPDWQFVIKAYAQQYRITKMKWIVSGGETRHDSVYKGLLSLRQIAREDDYIVIMDANRPLVSNEIIDDNIIKARESGGAALSAIPCFDSMYFSGNEDKAAKNLKRETVFIGQSPETIRFGKAVDLYEKANRLQICHLTTSGLLLEFGEEVAFSKGSKKNIKITTIEDIEIFKALLSNRMVPIKDIAEG